MNATDQELEHMRAAIDASKAAVASGNMPFGAVLVSAQGQRLQVSGNNQITSGDCTGHAEVVLIREATRALGASALKGATVYASGEPCAMCAGALFWAGAARIVYAMPTATINRIGGAPCLLATSAQVLQGASRTITIEGPLLETEAAAVLSDFVRAQTAPGA